MPTQLSKEEFKKAIMGSKNLSLVQFKTEWSGACQIISPMYQELAKAYRGQVDFYSIDADAEKELYQAYGNSELPAILFFKNGQLIDRVLGLTSRDKLVRKIGQALSAANHDKN